MRRMESEHEYEYCIFHCKARYCVLLVCSEGVLCIHTLYERRFNVVLCSRLRLATSAGPDDVSFQVPPGEDKKDTCSGALGHSVWFWFVVEPSGK